MGASFSSLGEQGAGFPAELPRDTGAPWDFSFLRSLVWGNEGGTKSSFLEVVRCSKFHLHLPLKESFLACENPWGKGAGYARTWILPKLRVRGWGAAKTQTPALGGCKRCCSSPRGTWGVRGHLLPISPRPSGSRQVSTQVPPGTARALPVPRGLNPRLGHHVLCPHGHGALPIAATASGHCRRELPGASVSQRALSARWLLPCSGERCRPPQALFPHTRGWGCCRLPDTPLLFFCLIFGFALLGWVCFLVLVFFFLN